MYNSRVKSIRQDSELDLKLRIHPDYLSVTVLNMSSQNIRLWELENSWGWYSFSLHLRGDPDQKAQVIRRKSREWTRNMPSFFILPPGQSREMHLNVNDGWWEKRKNFFELRAGPISIRVILRIDPSPEAEEYDVFVGTVVSGCIASMPPHNWLFATKGDKLP